MPLFNLQNEEQLTFKKNTLFRYSAAFRIGTSSSSLLQIFMLYISLRFSSDLEVDASKPEDNVRDIVHDPA